MEQKIFEKLTEEDQIQVTMMERRLEEIDKEKKELDKTINRLDKFFKNKTNFLG
jgi:ubiquinone biosynthesis protein UbiJ